MGEPHKTKQGIDRYQQILRRYERTLEIVSAFPQTKIEQIGGILRIVRYSQIAYAYLSQCGLNTL